MMLRILSKTPSMSVQRMNDDYMKHLKTKKRMMQKPVYFPVDKLINDSKKINNETFLPPIPYYQSSA